MLISALVSARNFLFVFVESSFLVLFFGLVSVAVYFSLCSSRNSSTLFRVVL